MSNLNNAHSTLSLQSSDTGICCEEAVAYGAQSLPLASRCSVGLSDSRLIVPSFEAIRNAFGKLYDINDFSLEKIASGFFGDVFKAQYKPTGEVMVVKCNKKNQGKMLREVELMRRLGDHTNIIKFKGGCVDGAKVYSVIEFMNGGTLEELLINAEQPITWPQREKLCHDISCGMQYLHGRNYMHRDLTTRNVLIRIDGNLSSDNDMRFHAVVADFGLAAEIPLRSPISQSGNSTQNSKPLAIVGSAWWMAPECIELAIKAKFNRTKERAYNERIDVFSFGIIVCQICARIEADPEYLHRTANYGVDYMSLSKLVADDPIARHLMLLAMDCTKYQPDDRPTFAQISDRLNRSRQFGPGHHLIDKRLRKQVWRPASICSSNNATSLSQPNTSSLNTLAVSQSSSISPVTASQLPQVWVHTVIRTIDPDFRPARSNPFAALEDHFRDGRKLFGSVSEGFGDSASSLSMSLSPGDHLANRVASARIAMMSPRSSVTSSASPAFVPVLSSANKVNSSFFEGCHSQHGVDVAVECSLPSNSSFHTPNLSSLNKREVLAPRSLPSSPITTRRAKSVYVSGNTAIRFFSPSNQEDQTDVLPAQSTNNARDVAISRGFTPSSRSNNRVVWSRVRFFETLSQEQQRRWHLMIANNKIAEEQRRLADEGLGSSGGADDVPA